MIRLLICDDQADTRTSLAMLLQLEADVQVIGQATGGAEAMQLAQELTPDLILMDLKMPGMNGVTAIQRISQTYPAIKIIALTTYNDDEWVRKALRAGAAGYLLKDAPREDLLRAVRGTLEGKSYVDPKVAGKLFARLSQLPVDSPGLGMEELSERDITLLQFIVSGFSNIQIAEQLCLTDGTIRNYMSVLFAKLGVTDRTQAAVLAIQHGIHPLV